MIPLNGAPFQQDLFNHVFMLHGKTSRCNFIAFARYLSPSRKVWGMLVMSGSAKVTEILFSLRQTSNSDVGNGPAVRKSVYYRELRKG